jgi:hypothetical protein
VRVIIAAAGGDAKWNGHLGVPRHMAPIEGEPLLQRTVRQAVAYTGDVHVTTPNDDRYRVIGAYRHVRAADYASEYDSTRDLWDEDGRTVLLYGDVFFTDQAMSTICGDARRAFRAYGRRGASQVTGTPYGELFAVSWWPEHHEQMDTHLDLVHSTRAAGTITRPPGWMLLRAWQGTPLNRHTVRRNRYFVRIDDATDDFDRPDDYARHPATRTATPTQAAG